VTPELQMLIWSSLLGLFQILLATTFVTIERGVKWNLSSRNQELPPPKGIAGRLNRAAENFKETFPFFIAAVVLIQFLGRNNSVTAIGAQLYLYGRILYIPVYAFDITHVRTAVWSVATFSILLVLSGVFF
jgi:uncharacterized MAPEG superfamily protein